MEKEISSFDPELSNHFSISKGEKKYSNDTPNGFEKQQNKLSICWITWNMHGENPSMTDLHNLINPHLSLENDIYAIGTEECLRSIFKSFFVTGKESYERQLENIFGKEYFLLETVNWSAIHLIIFVKIKHIHNIVDIHTNYVKTGANNLLGNKGGVSVWFTIYGIQIIIINSHLAAGKNNSWKRNAHFDYILSNIHENINMFDLVFFMGDLNYRLNLDLRKINEVLKKGNLKEIYTLLKYDQLQWERSEWRLKAECFNEGAIEFKPTFKYYNNTDIFQCEMEDQAAAWTDRILFKKKRMLDQNDMKFEWINYNSMQEVWMSDHKPVYAHFVLGIPN